MALFRQKRINRYKKILLPEASFSIGITGPELNFGVATTVVQSDKSYIDNLINVMDSKGSLYVAYDSELSGPVLDSVREIRGAALNAKNLVEGLDVAELCQDVIDACRNFMNSFRTEYSAESQALAMDAMRRGVLTAAAALVQICGLPDPRNLPLSQYEQSGLEVIEDMLVANSEVEDELLHRRS